jgi:hypothetical protein
MNLRWLLIWTGLLFVSEVSAQDFIVSADGSGDFKTVQDAILMIRGQFRQNVFPGHISWLKRKPENTLRKTYSLEKTTGILREF